jgi:hypothetical protein
MRNQCIEHLQLHFQFIHEPIIFLTNSCYIHNIIPHQQLSRHTFTISFYQPTTSTNKKSIIDHPQLHLQSSHEARKVEGNEALKVDELTNSTNIEVQQFITKVQDLTTFTN